MHKGQSIHSARKWFDVSHPFARERANGWGMEPHFSRLLLAAACICCALAVSPFAHSQAAPTAPKLDITGQPIVPNILLYDAFIHNLGEEDDRIQKEAQTGGAHSAGRRDFGSAIGFGKTDEQVMLAIVLDCYRQEKAKDDQLRADEINRHIYSEEFLIKATQEEREAADQEREKAYLQEIEPTRRAKYAILRETWSKLKNDLGEESFNKLDKYVNSRKWAPPERPGIGQISAPTDKIQGWTHMAYPGAYGDFFEDIGRENANNQRAAAEGREPTGFILPDSIPADKKQAVIAIALEAAREINENDQQYISAAREFDRLNEEKYGWKKAHEMPVPPEIDALRMGDLTIIEENTDKLREALGEKYFMALDREFSRSNRSREAAVDTADKGVAGSSSSAGSAVPHQSDNNSAPAQTPGVKP